MIRALWGNNSIIKKYVLIVIGISMTVLLVLLVITNQYIRKLENENVKEYMLSNLNVVATSIDTTLSNIENFHTDLVLDIDFTKNIKKLKAYESHVTYEEFQRAAAIQKVLEETSAKSDYIYSAYAYSFNSDRFFTSREAWNEKYNNLSMFSFEWIKTYQETDKGQPWHITYSVEESMPIITSYRELKEYDVPVYGLVSINVDAKNIVDLFKSVAAGQNEYCMIFDSDYSHISNAEITDELFENLTSKVDLRESRGFYSSEIEDEKYYILYDTSQYTKFTYLYAVLADKIQTVSPFILSMMIFYFTGFVVLLLLVIGVAYSVLYRPVNALFKGMEQIEAGNFDVRLPESPYMEIDFINTHFNNMTDNINRLIKENYVRELTNKEAQLKNILTKLNEHFLYNTLDTIHWKARAENASSTCNLIFKLATFYRLNLSNGQEYISVKQVIELISSYLDIQKERMGEKLEFRIECPESLEQRNVLKYLFQPLIENAVIHGGKNISHPLFIKIEFTALKNGILFSVEDNGNGIEEKQLEHLKERLQQEFINSSEHFALETLNTQLKINYGKSSKLHIASTQGKGCRVWFILPEETLKENLYDKTNNY